MYAATGLVAWVRRPSSRLGLLIVAGGGAWLLAGLANTAVPALAAAGTVTRTLALAVIVHLLLAFPTGRLRDRTARIVVLCGYGVCLILQAPLYLFAADGTLSLADRPGLASAGLEVQRVAGALVVLATAALLVRRMRQGTPAQRRVLAPLTVYGIFALLLIPVSSALADSLFGGGGFTLPVVQLAVLALVPGAFVVAASRGGFARTGDIAELGAWLGADEIARPALGEALAVTLGDPSAQLLFRLTGSDVLVDGSGAEVALPLPGGPRGVVEVELAGEPVGAIAYDAILLDRPGDVREAGRVVALALDRQRLAVELRASRARIAASADSERRRIARDLHDGLQSRLVFLAIQAGTGAAPACSARASTRRSTSCASSSTASCRRSSPSAGCTRRSRASRTGSRPPSCSRSPGWSNASRPRSRRRPTSWSRRRSSTPSSTPAPRRSRSRSSAATDTCGSRSTTTAAAASAAAAGRAAWPTASRRSTAGWRSTASPDRGTRVRAVIPCAS